jgi:hypothetical protein
MWILKNFLKYLINWEQYTMHYKSVSTYDAGAHYCPYIPVHTFIFSKK